MKKIGAATVRSNSDANKQRAGLHCRQPDTGKNLKYEALKESSLNLPRLLLALSSRKSKGNYKNIPTDFSVDTVTPYQGNALIENSGGRFVL